MADEDQEYYGYYYGDDEDRGLLDTAWENQQKKVWVFVILISIACYSNVCLEFVLLMIYMPLIFAYFTSISSIKCTSGCLGLSC